MFSRGSFCNPFKGFLRGNIYIQTPWVALGKRLRVRGPCPSGSPSCRRSGPRPRLGESMAATKGSTEKPSHGSLNLYNQEFFPGHTMVPTGCCSGDWKLRVGYNGTNRGEKGADVFGGLKALPPPNSKSQHRTTNARI